MSKLILGISSICILYQVYVNYCAIRIPWLIGFSYAEHQKTAESKTIEIEGRDERAHINFYSPEQDAHSRWSILKISQIILNIPRLRLSPISLVEIGLCKLL